MGNASKPRLGGTCYAGKSIKKEYKIGLSIIFMLILSVSLVSKYLFVEIFKVHEKEAKNDKYSHEVWNTIRKRLVPDIQMLLYIYTLHNNQVCSCY